MCTAAFAQEERAPRSLPRELSKPLSGGKSYISIVLATVKRAISRTVQHDELRAARRATDKHTSSMSLLFSYASELETATQKDKKPPGRSHDGLLGRSPRRAS